MSKTPNEQMLERLEGIDWLKYEAAICAEIAEMRLICPGQLIQKIDFKKLAQALDKAIEQELKKVRSDLNPK